MTRRSSPATSPRPWWCRARVPVLIDCYLRDAIEVDVDALADGKDVFICGVMEHIEEAGVHSGDSACSLPPHSLKPQHHRRHGAPDRRSWPGRSTWSG